MQLGRGTDTSIRYTDASIYNKSFTATAIEGEPSFYNFIFSFHSQFSNFLSLSLTVNQMNSHYLATISSNRSHSPPALLSPAISCHFRTRAMTRFQPPHLQSPYPSELLQPLPLHPPPVSISTLAELIITTHHNHISSFSSSNLQDHHQCLDPRVFALLHTASAPSHIRSH